MKPEIIDKDARIAELEAQVRKLETLIEYTAQCLRPDAERNGTYTQSDYRRTKGETRQELEKQFQAALKRWAKEARA